MSKANDSPQKTERRHVWSRVMLAGPVCFVTAALVMAGGALWVPAGPASIDNIAVPIVLFPAIWATLFFYLMLDRKLWRAWCVALTLSTVHGGVIVSQMAAPNAESKQAPTEGGSR